MSLQDLPRLRTCKRGRTSSYDRSGGNEDSVPVAAGNSRTLLDLKGSGRITHLWVTMMGDENPHMLRTTSIRMWWDGEDEPSVDAPIGDFFGVGHGETRNFVSAPIQQSPQDGKGMNCWWPMPFSTSARIEVWNEAEHDVTHFFFYVDYELTEAPESDVGTFHAWFTRQDPTDGIDETGIENHSFQMEGLNPDGGGNYDVLRAVGRGHYVGCVMSITNLRRTTESNWYGEGDDMIFIDGDATPTLHGTGTEDYFNTAWGPRQVHHAPYHGITMPGGPNWSGRISLYRFHIEDPIIFHESIRVSIEHGHANRRSDDWASVAFWYQSEPHGLLMPRVPASGRLPHPW